MFQAALFETMKTNGAMSMAQSMISEAAHRSPFTDHVLIEKEPTLGATPSYASVVRFMNVHGLSKRPRRGPLHSPGAQATEHRIETREIRSYESQYVNALCIAASALA